MSSKLCSLEEDNDDKKVIDSTVMRNELENWLDSVEEGTENFCISFN